jgi:Bacterial protein of unknown function (DUF899)
VNAVGTRLDVVEERRPVAKPDQLGEIEMTTTGNLPELVSREEWLVARMELLLKEKELTRARDRVNADRRRLPMVASTSRRRSSARTGRWACSTCSRAGLSW